MLTKDLVRLPQSFSEEKTFNGATFVTAQSEKVTQGNLIGLLKSTNESAHRRLEDVIDIINPALTPQDYSALIRRFYGYIAVWETKLRSEMPSSFMPLFENRFKIEWLRQDMLELRALEKPPHEPHLFASVPLCNVMPDMSTPARMLGTAYVIEGSSLGSRFICAHLEQRGNAFPHRYFECYGAETGSMWKRYLGAMTSHVEVKNYPDAVSAATQTFAGLIDWFSGIERPSTNRHA